MRRIVQILYSGLGGHSSVAFSIVEADQNKEFDHKLLFFGIEELSPSYAERCNRDNIGFFTVVKKSKVPFSDWRRIFRKLASWKPDTIILHSTTLIFPLALYRKTHSCKLIFVEHTSNHMKSVNERLSSHLGMLFADHVILLTNAYREQIEKMTGPSYKPRKVAVIPNGINIDKFHPSGKDPGLPVMHIGMIGRFFEGKCQEELIEAFKALIEEKPARALHLHLAGEGTTLQRLKTLVQEYGLEKEITFYGNISEEEIIRMLLQLDIYVQATKGETMSTSIMQAMACALPVIGTEVAGVSNMIDDGVTGLLYKANVKNGLKDTMQKLMMSDTLRQTLSINAREFAVKEYSLHIMFEKYTALF